MSDLIRREDAIDYFVTNIVVVDADGYAVDDYDERVKVWTERFSGIPSAELEQKKGKWVEVHGYVTPGGDPVWKCSECGKGIHVYGIEAPSYNRDYTDGHQWVACPNCGARME